MVFRSPLCADFFEYFCNEYRVRAVILLTSLTAKESAINVNHQLFEFTVATINSPTMKREMTGSAVHNASLLNELLGANNTQKSSGTKK